MKYYFRYEIFAIYGITELCGGTVRCPRCKSKIHPLRKAGGAVLEWLLDVTKGLRLSSMIQLITVQGMWQDSGSDTMFT